MPDKKPTNDEQLLQKLRQNIEEALLELYKTYQKIDGAKGFGTPEELAQKLQDKKFGITDFQQYISGLDDLLEDNDEIDQQLNALNEAQQVYRSALQLHPKGYTAASKNPQSSKPPEKESFLSQAWDFTKKATPYVVAAGVGLVLAGPVGAVVMTGVVYGGKSMFGGSSAKGKEIKVEPKPVDPRSKWKAEAQAKKAEAEKNKPKASSDNTLSDTDSQVSRSNSSSMSTTVSQDDNASVNDTFNAVTNDDDPTVSEPQHDSQASSTKNNPDESSSNTFGSGR